MSQIKLGIYYHFKKPDVFYEVLGAAQHTENETEKLVIYRRVDDHDKMFARPEAMFLEIVDKPENNYQGPRFVWVRETRSVRL